MTERFAKEKNLLNIKPDIRQFGFDCSMGQTGVGENSHKYQVWAYCEYNHRFYYTPRKRKKWRCRFEIDASSYFINIKGNHFGNNKNMMTELPEDIIEKIKVKETGVLGYYLATGSCF